MIAWCVAVAKGRHTIALVGIEMAFTVFRQLIVFAKAVGQRIHVGILPIICESAA